MGLLSVLLLMFGSRIIAQLNSGRHIFYLNYFIE